MLTIDEHKKELILNNIELANNIAKNQSRIYYYVDSNEIVSAAYMGLVDAAVKYNSDLCDCFPAYARIRIIGSIIDYLREIGWGTKSQPFQRKDLCDDYAYNEKPSICEEFFNKLTCGLTDNLKTVLKKYYFEDCKVREIAKEMGLDRSRVSQLLCQARVAIKNRWTNERFELWAEV